MVFTELCREEEKPTEEEIKEENLRTYDPTPLKVILVNSDGSSEMVSVSPASIKPNRSEYGAAAPAYVEPESIPEVPASEASESISEVSASIEPESSEYGSVLSNVVILAEDKMKTAAWIAAVVVALVGVWLTIATVRDFRKSKNRGEDK